MVFAEKVIVAFISSVTLSSLLVLLFFLQAGSETTWNFITLFAIYFIYSGPVYLIGGSLYSAFVDIFVEPERFDNKFLRYLITFAVYAAGGLIIMGIWLFIVTGGFDEIWQSMSEMAFIGIPAALLYFHILLIWRVLSDYREV